MDKSFNDLFNEFFKDNKPKQKKSKAKSESSNIKSHEVLNIIDKIMKTEKMTEDDEETLDNSLGKPDKIEYFQDGEYYVQKNVWYTEEGEFIKLILNDEPFNEKTKIIKEKIEPEKTLEELLNQAVESEKYEIAARIRDEIKKKK